MTAARAGYSIAELPAPDVVVIAADATDVIAAVSFARDQQLPIGVKATGHNFGFAWPGGLMINTERMQGVRIDPIMRTAQVAAGVRWRDVIAAAHAYGLAPLSGSTSRCWCGWLHTVGRVRLAAAPVRRGRR